MDSLKTILIDVTSNLVSELLILGIPILLTIVPCLFYKNSPWLFYILLFIFNLLMWCYIHIKYVKVRRNITSREETMKSNTLLLKKSKANKYYSTRITLWPVTESSTNRVAFRNELTKKIESGKEVKRLWHIKNKEDYNRMLYYLEKYKEFDNYSLKCYIDNDFLMQEIFICHEQSASISLPQPYSPRKICVCYQYFSKKDIEIWTEYFKLLWEKSIPIFVDGRINQENIKKLELKFK